MSTLEYLSLYSFSEVPKGESSEAPPPHSRERLGPQSQAGRGHPSREPCTLWVGALEDSFREGNQAPRQQIKGPGRVQRGCRHVVMQPGELLPAPASLPTCPRILALAACHSLLDTESWCRAHFQRAWGLPAAQRTQGPSLASLSDHDCDHPALHL